jgi:hypothetical protein
MAKISIYFYDNCFPSHCLTHIAAVIEAEVEEKKYIIEYGYGEESPDELAFPNEYTDLVVLYSKKDINGFIECYQQEFKEQDYRFLYKNCADAVNRALDYFFTESTAEQCWFAAKKMLCCLPGILFFSGSCAPAPLLITTPKSVFAKAKSIAAATTKKTFPLDDIKLDISIHGLKP